MRVSTCVGNYAKTPYSISDLGMNIYCMEEFCYCVRENAYLLDPSMAGDKLVEWIDHECGLHDLARVLNSLVYRKDAFLTIIHTILKYVGFYEEQTIADIMSVLQQGFGRSNIERKKSQIDYLVEKKKYIAAVKAYDKLIEHWKELSLKGEILPPISCLAGIWHNKGVAYARLMLYGNAAECFEKSNEIEPSAEVYKEYLAAKRMELSEENYVSFVADNMDGYEATLELEHEMENYIREWEEQPEFLRLYNRREMREGVEAGRYFEESEQIVRILKDSYRSSVAD